MTAINIAARHGSRDGISLQPRARGLLRVESSFRRGASALADLHQAGSLKLLFPVSARRGDLLGVCVNTAGGITGGDRLLISARAGQDSRLTLTGQAAERIYRARDGEVATLSTRLSVAPGARLDWLPQETILFDGCAFRRDLSIEMDETARFLSVEPIVFGRRLMGESLRRVFLQDNIRLTRGGTLVFADAIRLEGEVAGQLASRFTLRGAGAAAGVIYAAPDADLLLPRIRALLPGRGGASLIRDGILFVRMLAEDGLLLRQSLVPIIEALHGAELPRTWML